MGTEQQMYYIVSVRHTQRSHIYITFWRPNDAGYAYPLSWSGKYPREHVLGNLGYYNNGWDTIAVPCEAVEMLAGAPEKGRIDNDAGPVVRNTRLSWLVLLKNVIEPPRNKPEPQYRGAPRSKEVA